MIRRKFFIIFYSTKINFFKVIQIKQIKIKMIMKLKLIKINY